MRFTQILPACALLLSSAGLSAQEPPAATLEVEVVDSVTGQPVAGVLLRLDSGPETLSDEEGRFRLVGLEPGPHMFALLTHDCRITWSEVELTPGQVSRVEVRLASALGTRVEREQEEAERRGGSAGELVTADEIEEMNAMTLADVIRRVKPTMIGAPRGTVGAPTSVRGRSRNSFLSRTGEGEPVVVVDGVRVADGAQALDVIRPSEVETLELLPGAVAGWEFGSAGSAGVIRVTTRRGARASSRSGAEGCIVPDFPVGVRRVPG